MTRSVEIPEAAVEQACEVMHDAYERAAVIHAWETNPASRHQDWADVPEANKATMRDAVRALLRWQLAALPYLAPAGPEQPWLMIHHIRAVRDAGYVVKIPGDRDAQVDAAARAIHRWDKKPITWGNLTPDEKSQYRSEAEAVIDALSVTAPAGDGGLREALETLAKERDDVGGHTASDYMIRPYELRELLAAHPAAPAVPQPVDREALIDALRRTASHHEDHDGAVWVDGWAQDFAEAVLAVLAGEQEQAE